MDPSEEVPAVDEPVVADEPATEAPADENGASVEDAPAELQTAAGEEGSPDEGAEASAGATQEEEPAVAPAPLPESHAPPAKPTAPAAAASKSPIAPKAKPAPIATKPNATAAYGKPAASPKPAPAAQPKPQPPSPGKAGSQPSSKLTFTGPPDASTAKKQVRADYSHSNYQVMKITSENNKLCQRLLEISSSPAKGAPGGPAPKQPVAVGHSAATVNRRRREDKIAQENLAIYKRLQAIKPSKDVSRETLSKEFKAQQDYGRNARKFRDPHAPAATGSPRAGAAGTRVVASTAPPADEGATYDEPHAHQEEQQEQEEQEEEQEQGQLQADAPAPTQGEEVAAGGDE
eukprot:CAMPEP_0202859376 /NCGR_PEP_ID=MMETSP1391-20130828/1517_1 /ASSEMBLY_ACC=CAM_ASM_000867 /TAXON_ID=1034604 /ORGANISM="Chlamydomonas leiostraca, Strain SAG 11-49" /LENGTH=346 /DNA_ID=CAMNT_0049538403 /DNA_START=54 /DNA_END=1094 /DNA_ORIENTATION=+